MDNSEISSWTIDDRSIQMRKFSEDVGSEHRWNLVPPLWYERSINITLLLWTLSRAKILEKDFPIGKSYANGSNYYNSLSFWRQTLNCRTTFAYI